MIIYKKEIIPNNQYLIEGSNVSHGKKSTTKEIIPEIPAIIAKYLSNIFLSNKLRLLFIYYQILIIFF